MSATCLTTVCNLVTDECLYASYIKNKRTKYLTEVQQQDPVLFTKYFIR